MMGTLRRSDVSTPGTSQGRYSRPQALNAVPLRAMSTRPKASLADRVRTFFDRTLDAAFGRFDH